MRKGLYLAAILIFGNESHAWVENERVAYQERHFIVLEHLLVSQGNRKELDFIRAQERDLPGCRALHHGAGALDSALHCIRFLNREKAKGLKSEGADGLVRDINVLCPRLMGGSGALIRILARPDLKSAKNRWRPCAREAWKQVYLTAYARFDANPVGTLALIRKAQANLPAAEPWSSKVSALVRVP